MAWLIQRLCLIGKIPLCNGIASRAPHIFGYCFILCYRCTFFVLFFIGTLYVIWKREIKSIRYVWLLLLPMIIDGSAQTFFGYMSNNLRRSITGALFGLAAAIMIKYVFQKVDEM